MPMRFTRALWLLLPVMLAACASVQPVEEAVVTDPEVLQIDEVPMPSLAPGTEALFEQAVALMQARDHAAAQVLFEALTRSQPELAGPWVNLGHIHNSAGQPDLARQAFEQALAANPANCDAHNQLGVMARRDGRFVEAEHHYLRCLEAHPDFSRARLNLGILYELYMGRLGEALAAYHDYQSALNTPDARVNGWVIDLERRMAAVARR